MPELRGVDIAGYQSSSATLYKTYDFVIVKTTEGRTYINPKWRAQLNAAIKNGQLVGVYHYCRPENNTPLTEARFFVNTAKDYIGKVIFCADWEQIALKYPATWLMEFLQEVERLTGSKPFLYIQQSAISRGKYNALARAGYPLWMAQYNSRMSKAIGAWPRVTIWQYTSTGGKLDKDIFFGTREDWLGYISGKKEEKKGVKIVGATKKGMEGVQVKGLQTMLKDYGYYSATIDGKFGDKTLAAVKAFQKAEGLTVDGIVGEKTWSRLAGLA